MLKDCNLFDLGFHGHHYTFSNRRMGSHEYKARLGRALTCGLWKNSFPRARVEHVATMTSDHYLLLIYFLDTCFSSKEKQFHFEPMWFRSKEFRQNIHNFWPSHLPHEGPLQNRIKNCPDAIIEWNKSSFGSVQGHLRRLRKELDCVKKRVRDDVSTEDERNIMNELDEWR